MEHGRTRATWGTLRAVNMWVVVPLSLVGCAAIGAAISALDDGLGAVTLGSVIVLPVFYLVLLALVHRFPRRTHDLQVLGAEDPVAAEVATAEGQQITVDPRLIRSVRIDEVVSHAFRRRRFVQPQRGDRGTVDSYDVIVTDESGADFAVATSFLHRGDAAELQDLLAGGRDVAPRAVGQAAPPSQPALARSVGQAGLADGELVVAVPPQPWWLIVVPSGFVAAVCFFAILVGLLRGEVTHPAGVSAVGLIFLVSLALCVAEFRRRVRLTIRSETIDVQVTGGFRGSRRFSVPRATTDLVSFDGGGPSMNVTVVADDGIGSRLVRNLDTGRAMGLHDALKRYGWPVNEIRIALSR